MTEEWPATPSGARVTKRLIHLIRSLMENPEKWV